MLKHEQHLKIRKAINKSDLVNFLAWARESSEEAFLRLRGLEDCILADIVASAFMVSAVRSTGWAMTAPPRMIQERLNRDWTVREAAEELTKSGAGQLSSTEGLHHIERSGDARKNINMKLRHAIEMVYDTSWQELCMPITDERIPLTIEAPVNPGEPIAFGARKRKEK